MKKLFTKKTEQLTKSQRRRIEIMEEDSSLGDGKAVFLSDMNEEEIEEYKENDVNGWAKFKKKVFGLKSKN